MLSKINNYLNSLQWWHYYLTHAAIALAIMCVLWPILGYQSAVIIAALVYLLHELNDHFRLHKNNGQFDWPGLFSPWAVVFGIGFFRSLFG